MGTCAGPVLHRGRGGKRGVDPDGGKRFSTQGKDWRKMRNFVQIMERDQGYCGDEFVVL